MVPHIELIPFVLLGPHRIRTMKLKWGPGSVGHITLSGTIILFCEGFSIIHPKFQGSRLHSLYFFGPKLIRFYDPLWTFIFLVQILRRVVGGERGEAAPPSAIKTQPLSSIPEFLKIPLVKTRGKGARTQSFRLALMRLSFAQEIQYLVIFIVDQRILSLPS